MAFKFEERQKIIFEVYDADDRDNLHRLDKQDFVGRKLIKYLREDHNLPT